MSRSSTSKLLLAITAMILAPWLAARAGTMQETVPTETVPTADGKVMEGEYGAWARGINKSFGDRIGQRSKVFLRSTTDGRLCIGIRSVNGFPDNAADGAVMYIDSVEGGFKTTADFTDHSTVPRGLVSGMGSKTGARAVINFAPDFEADYAVYIRYSDAGVFKLSTTNHELLAVGSVNSTSGSVQYVQSNGTNLEVQLPLASIGLTPFSQVKFVMTLLNGADAYRSDEFMGVSSYPAGSVGQKTVTLNAGDYLIYVPPHD